MIHHILLLLEGLQTGYLIHRSSRTGKTTIIQFLEYLAGSDNCWAGSFEQLDNPFYLARLKGKRLAMFSEISEIKGQHANIIKALLGQDSMAGAVKLQTEAVKFTFEGISN